MQVLQRSAQNNAAAIEHVLPQDTTPDDAELSIVIPAMNEEITVGEFMEWCKEGIERAGVTAQILIVDSLTETTRRRLCLNTAARFYAFRSTESVARTRTHFPVSGENGF